MGTCWFLLASLGGGRRREWRTEKYNSFSLLSVYAIPFPRFGLNLTAAPLVGEKNNFILYGPGEQGQCNTARNGPLLGDMLDLPNMTCIPNFLLILKASINHKHWFV